VVFFTIISLPLDRVCPNTSNNEATSKTRCPGGRRMLYAARGYGTRSPLGKPSRQRYSQIIEAPASAVISATS